MPGPIPKVLFSSGLGEPRYQHLTSPTGHSNMPTGQSDNTKEKLESRRRGEGASFFCLLDTPDNMAPTLAFGPGSIRDFRL